MRLLIALVTGLAVLALAACSEPNADGPHRSQSGKATDARRLAPVGAKPRIERALRQPARGRVDVVALGGDGAVREHAEDVVAQHRQHERCQAEPQKRRLSRMRKRVRNETPPPCDGEPPADDQRSEKEKPRNVRRVALIDLQRPCIKKASPRACRQDRQASEKSPFVARKQGFRPICECIEREEGLRRGACTGWSVLSVRTIW